MSKHIDLELALNEMLRLYEEDVDAYVVEIPETFDYQRAKEALMRIPTIEVSADYVEVVRCEDCKYRNTIPRLDIVLSEGCRWASDESPNDDDYCSYGERKEE